MKHIAETKAKKIHGNTGKKLSQKHRKNIGLGRLGKKFRPHSEETKEKIRLAHLGKPLSDKIKEYMDKNNVGMRGNTHTEEAKVKMSLGNFGDKNPNWKGGIACEPYCDAWADKEYKESIKERDNHTCQNPDCWHTSKRLCIHHIDYDKKNCSPDNLITLCNSCNTRANKNRKWHTKFYQNIINSQKDKKEWKMKCDKCGNYSNIRFCTDEGNICDECEEKRKKYKT